VPSSSPQLENALRLHRAGQLAPAAAIYREILRTEPNQQDALNLLGLVKQQGGDHAQAAELFAKAAASNPGNPFFMLNRGVSLRALGQQEAAAGELKKALALDPNLAEAHHQLGNALKSLHRFAEAAASLRRAKELNPKNAAIWLNLGAALLELSMRDEAIACFRRAIPLEPERPEARNILGSALLDAGLLGEAKEQLQVALRLRPAYPAAHDNLGRALRAQGRAAEAAEAFRTALAAAPQPGTHSNLVYALNFVPGLSSSEVFTEHKRWATIHAVPLKKEQRPFTTAFEPERRLRIGYVSPDFVHHAVSYFIEPVLAAHARTQVEVFCYSNVSVPDAVTARLRALSDHWRDIACLDDAQVAELVRSDKIDILVDLAGHTARHRLLVFARMPAPVQVTWLGYPNTTGLDAIDYRITDAVSDPLGQTEAWQSEKLIRLPETFSCYRPSPVAPDVSELPALKNGYITFGSFNHFAKINPAVLDLWARLLVRLPSARMLLKARSLSDPETAVHILNSFADRGIGEGRIALRSDELSVPAQLGLYHRVDIALDPFPYNGTTTTCEALWMGVPVVTVAGQTHVSRVSASLLTHLGRPEWIAHSEDEYIEKCASLVADLPRLADLRAGQRERMRLSPLCDAARFTAHLETAYREMWRSRCAAEPRNIPSRSSIQSNTPTP
jgi:predicted O-linked N-acetylglucosamine transferase (SPINDLY family)